MRSSLTVLALCLVAAGCSSPNDTSPRQESSSPQMAEASEEIAADASGAARAPGISITAAPGVAFNYSYAFRLLPGRIATVQEAHAQQCEKLGIARCRITGMRYSVEDEDRISAMLSLKLDPSVARSFGKDGIAAVEKAEGMLVDAQITGVDAGAEIKSATRGVATLQDELNRIEAQLRAGGLSNAARGELNIRASDLRDQIRSLTAGKTAAQDSLATTPMVFEYRAGHSIPGLDGGSPVADALEIAARSFMTMLSFLLIAIGVLLPWVLLIGGLYWLAKRLRPDWFVKSKAVAVPQES